MSKLLISNPVYKPFNYPWCHEAWLKQNQVHWLFEEVPLAEDVRDWRTKLSVEEINLLTQIFRFFTQQDIIVGGAYTDAYLKVFKPTEVRMMLTTFASMETMHVAAYAYLLDTIGMPEVEYQAFMKYAAMKEKFEYLQNFNVDTPKDIAKSLAVFSAFTEGLQLFASFAMLMNFPRFNKMKGMGQIVAWSVRDETLHVESMIKLFRTFIQENPEIWTDDFRKELYDICREMVDHEDAFIDLAFEQGPVQGMTSEDLKGYIRFIADRRLQQLGLKPNYHIKENPLPWMDEILNAPEFVNFFENRATEYSRAATKGTWDEAFGLPELPEGHYQLGGVEVSVERPLDSDPKITMMEQLENIPTDKWLVYGQVSCPQCTQAKKTLDKVGANYEYIDLTGQVERKSELYDQTNARSMPIIFLNDKFFGSVFDLEKLFNSGVQS